MREEEQLDPEEVIEAIIELSTSPDHSGKRLDVVLAEQLEQYSRSLIQDWIRDGRVVVDGAPVKASHKVKAGQTVLIEIPPLAPADPEPDPTIPLDVLYEDPFVLVLNKQRGLVVHPAQSNLDGTLVNALLARCGDLSGIRGVERPGIVHRLDKNTSGLMVIAKNDRAHMSLQEQFRSRTVLKVYEALTHGVPHPRRGTINQAIARHVVDRKRMAVRPDGKTAISDYRVMESFGDDYALVEVHIHTGRTHQIRVHLAWLGNPVVGDPLYGRKSNPFGLEGQALHCRRLGFLHPAENRPLEFEAPVPRIFDRILTRLREQHGDYRVEM